MVRRTIDEADVTMATSGEFPVVPNTSAGSLDRGPNVDLESCCTDASDGNPAPNKSVSFEEACRGREVADSNVSTSMLAAAAAAAVKSQGDNRLKEKNRSTYPLSPSSVRTAPTMASQESFDPPSPQVVTMEHKVKQSRSNGMIKALRKPVVLACVAVVMLLTGGTAFFFKGWLTIPGLKEQISRLSAEVDGLEAQVDELESQVDRLGDEIDRLGGEVDRLSGENDRLAQLNTELEENIDSYAAENARLNATLAEYEELNTQLVETVEQLDEINDQLHDQNQQYSSLNNDLNATTMQLGVQIDRLERLIGNLTETNRELRELNDALANETTRLSDLKDDMNETVTRLDGEVSELSAENERLAALNAHLETIVSFLNETASDIRNSYQDIAEYLAEQITAYRVLVLDTLQNLYLQRISRWDCDFQSFFLSKPFATNRSMQIGQEDYPVVMEYVEERVLSELCLSESDFVGFLESVAVPRANLTMNHLVTAVSAYTSDALEYYFPNGDSPGLTSDDWSEANYNCDFLLANQTYRFS